VILKPKGFRGLDFKVVRKGIHSPNPARIAKLVGSRAFTQDDNHFGVGLFLNPLLYFLPGFRLPAFWRTILEIKTPEALWGDLI
jgi:hypothetical protein